MASRISKISKIPAATVDKRRAPRHTVRISRATVRQHGETAADAILHDLSIYGCRVMSVIGHQDGERVWLRFQGTAPVAATIVWTDDKFAGCRFDEPIPNSLLRSLTLGIELVPNTQIA